MQSADLVLPDGAPEWAFDRSALWNAAESAEKRKDACVAREFEVALPAELFAKSRKRLALEFAKEMANREGCAVDVAIHAPDRKGDDRNYHAHILRTTRKVAASGLGDKLDTEKAGRKRSDDLEAVRARWAEMVNEALERDGHIEQVDHRSLKAQGVDREPTKHLGPSATGYERRTGQASRRRLDWDKEVAERLAAAKEQGEISRQAAKIEQTILDLSGDLERAKAERRQQVSDKYGLKTAAEAVDCINTHEPTGQKPAKKLTIANLYGLGVEPNPEEKPEVAKVVHKQAPTVEQAMSEHGWGVKIAGLIPAPEQQQMPEIQEKEAPKETQRPPFDMQAYLQKVELSVDRWKSGQASKDDADRINGFATVYRNKRHKIYEQIDRCSTTAKRLWHKLNDRLTEHRRREPQKPTGMGAIFKQGEYKEALRLWQGKEIELHRRFKKIAAIDKRFASMSWNPGYGKLADKKMGERFTERAYFLYQSIERETQRREVAKQNRLNQLELEPKRGPRR
ncbi:MobA/MobL family protein [Fluviibacter phosphoraccumulans]|uniref:MobA/MobL family protein n=1 Tax=Fluviibacter phosphoraccumulans TaxID=1751046 RepID=UPI001FD45F55|nr:MobA/MobL family protein [Fluviibacter phosphoraccumulans]